MRSTEKVGKFLRLVGGMFIAFSPLFVIIGVLLGGIVLFGCVFGFIIFIAIGLILFHTANVAIRDRIIVYEKGTVIQGTVASIEWVREQDSDGTISRHLKITVSYNDVYGNSITKALTDGQFYKETDFQIHQPIELCIYNDFVLVN